MKRNNGHNEGVNDYCGSFDIIDELLNEWLIDYCGSCNIIGELLNGLLIAKAIIFVNPGICRIF